MKQTPQREPIAIVGIGCRFPGGVADPEGFWRALREGVDAVTGIPADRFDADALFKEGAPAPGRIGTRWGGFLDGIDRFDPQAFGISPREAELLDPQQRLLLETGWEAIEDAGIVADRLRGSRAGVFVGLWLNDFEARLFADPAVEFHMTTGSGRYAASGRISYTLGVQGPSLTIDTACSSSLVAVHLACRSLWSGECPVALAGGANVILQPHITIAYSQSGMMAADGRCKFGDARANGYVRSEGAAMLVLKPLSRAVADGDRVYALIRGSAVNNDGRSGDYLATPAQAGQEQMLRLAYEDAGIAPGRVDYVEAHGTGTGAGDPVELGALGAVLAEARPAGRKCAVGSVKTNFGHTEGAAGVAGLIKAALVLRNRFVPASLHFREPNPAIAWDRIPLFVAGEPLPLPGPDGPLFAGVSSFGIAGTNAHVVLESPPAPAPAPASSPAPDEPARPTLVPLSAHSADALRAQAERWAGRLESADAPPLRDVACTASRRRDHHAHRLGLVVASRAELAERLRGHAAGEPGPDAIAGERRLQAPRVVFIFPGQGSQWPGMGRELLAAEPVFRRALEECAEAMRPFVDWSLREQLALEPDDPRWLLDRIDVVQPVLVALDIALARLWRSWGIEPAAVIGHSMGEVAAAAVAGALELDDAMRVICLRSRLLRRISGRGAMAVVELPRAEAEAALAGHADRVAVAAANSPRSTILSGEPDALRSVLEQLERRQVFCRWVNVDVASHSPQVDPLRGDLLAALDGIRPRVPAVPFHSTALGRAVEAAELDPDYWVANLRRPVLFAEGVQRLVDAGHDAFVEVSPHPVLLPAVQQTLQHGGSDALALGSLRRAEPERTALLRSLGALYVAGAPIDWERVGPEGRFTSLPTYPWQRERFWYEPPRRRARRGDGTGHPIFGAPLRTAAGHRFWEADLELAGAPFLADHRVRGRAVLPAAAYLELGLAAGPENGSAFLEQFRFDHPLEVAGDGEDGEAAQEVQVVAQRETDRAATLSFFGRARAGDDDAWTRCAAGRVVSETSPDAAASDGPSAGPLPRPADPGGPVAAFYDALAGRGLEYGARFRGIEAFAAEDGTATARLRLPEPLRLDAARYRIHPVLIDGALQLVLGTLGDADPDGTFVPIAVRRLRLHRRPEPGEALWARAVRRAAPAGLLGDVEVRDGRGGAVLTVEGVLFRHLPAADTAAGRLGERLFALQWEPRPLAPATSDAAAGPGTWLLLADRSGVAERLARRLEARGHACLHVHAASAYRDGGDGIEIDPRQPEHFDRVLAAAAAERPLRGVVHLWSLDTAAEPAAVDELDAAQALGTIGVLHLAQALTRRDADARARLWLVTRGAVPADDTGIASAAGVAHAAVWGMAGVIGNEHPELRTVCVDLDASPAASEAMAEELLADGADDRVALRGGERSVVRLARLEPGAVAGPGAGEAAVEARRVPAPYAVVTTGAGVLDNLRVRPRPRRSPGRGEVEIEVRAVGLNFMNVMSALGTYPGYPDGLGPLGIECAGVVAAVGEAVDDVAVGDEVVAFAFDCLATHAVADARLVAPSPPGLDFDAAATVPIAFLTAGYALEHLGRIAPGERVLIHAATGGVGLAALQLARAAGAEVFATAGSDGKRRYLRELGVEHVFDSRSLGFADEVLAATGGEGVDVVLNSLAGEAAVRGLSILRPFGRFLELGKRDIHDGARFELSPFRNQLTYAAIDLDAAARQRPALLGRLLREVVGRVGRGELAPLPLRAFPVSRVAEAFHHMARARHIGKVVITTEAAAETTEPAGALRADGSYLITGGLGALGLEVARWMVDRGARHLVLCGRSEPSATARAAIDVLRGLGAQVRVERADVGRASEVERVLERIEREVPPLRGVVHAAGLLADATLQQMDAARLAEAMAPKLHGAWNLHRLTRDRPLELFVLFSSVAATLGTPGQANYAAGNAAMDALAHLRRAQGLPALSIGWGPWGDIGLAAARNDRGQRLADVGLGSLDPAEGIAALDALLQRDRPPHVVVARLDAARWCEHHPGAAASPLLARLRDERGANTPAAGGVPVRDEITALTGRERIARLEAQLRTRAAQVLRLSTERVALGQPLKALGLDSLMSLELRNRIEADLGVPLSATAIWNYPTISLLARHLAERLEPEGAAPAAPPAGAPSEAGDEPASGEIVELDREQLQSLLDRELAAIDDLLGEE